MQPDILIKYLEQTANSLQNDGMLQRFQMLVYPDECLWQWSNRAPNAAAAQDVANLFQRLATLQALKLGAENQAEKQSQPYFCFDDAAQDFFQQWMTNLQTKTIPLCDHPLIAQHLSKYPKLFAALALIFHLVDCLTNQTRGKVGINSAKRAAAWCAFLEAHARRCYGLLLDDGLRAAQALASKIKQGELQDGFTAREINRKQWRNLCTYEAIQAALEWLEDDHWLRHEESGGIGPGSGRRTVRFYINPSITQALRKPVAGDA